MPTNINTVDGSNYDETDFFESEIQPKIQEIIDLCQNRRIPLVFAAQIGNNDNEYLIANASGNNGRMTSSQLIIQIAASSDNLNESDQLMLISIMRDMIESKEDDSNEG